MSVVNLNQSSNICDFQASENWEFLPDVFSEIFKQIASNGKSITYKAFSSCKTVNKYWNSLVEHEQVLRKIIYSWTGRFPVSKEGINLSGEFIQGANFWFNISLFGCWKLQSFPPTKDPLEKTKNEFLINFINDPAKTLKSAEFRVEDFINLIKTFKTLSTTGSSLVEKVLNLQFYEDKGLLVITGSDGVIEIWNVYEKTKHSSIKMKDLAPDANIFAISFANDCVFFADANDTMSVWSISKKEFVRNICPEVLGKIERLLVSQDEKRLFLNKGGRECIWNISKKTMENMSFGFPLLLESEDNQFLFRIGKKIGIYALNEEKLFEHSLFTGELEPDKVKLHSITDGNQIVLARKDQLECLAFNPIPLKKLLQEILIKFKNFSALNGFLPFSELSQDVKEKIYQEYLSIHGPRWEGLYEGWAEDAFHCRNGQSSSKEERDQVIRSVMQSEFKELFKNFQQLPVDVKDGIYKELYEIIIYFADDFWDLVERAFYGRQCFDLQVTWPQRIQAIENYMKKMG